jgi:hypothetical protein
VSTLNTLENAIFYLFFFFAFFNFFFKKNINNILKLYIINRKLNLKFIYYFMLGNPTNGGRSDKPRVFRLFERAVNGTGTGVYQNGHHWTSFPT